MEASKVLCLFPSPTPTAVLYSAWVLPPCSVERLPPCPPVPSCSSRARWPATLPAFSEWCTSRFPAAAGRECSAQDPGGGKPVPAALFWGIRWRLKCVCLLCAFGRAAQAFPYFLVGFFGFVLGWVFVCLFVGVFFVFFFYESSLSMSVTYSIPLQVPHCNHLPAQLYSSTQRCVARALWSANLWADGLHCSAVGIHTQMAFRMLLIWCDSKISQRLKSGKSLGRSQICCTSLSHYTDVHCRFYLFSSERWCCTSLFLLPSVLTCKDHLQAELYFSASETRSHWAEWVTNAIFHSLI